MTTELILTLLNLKGIGKVRANKIINKDYVNELSDIPTAIGMVTNSVSVTMRDIQKANDEAKSLIEGYIKAGVQVYTRVDDGYPDCLEVLDTDAPPVIYVKGNANLLIANRKIAVIGSRNIEDYHAEEIRRYAKELADLGVVIVSGLALGADKAAHEGCLLADSKLNRNTIAVMPCGLEKVVPSQHEKLAEEILNNNGCLISEYPLNQRVMPNLFVERDRIQAALSHAVFATITSIKGGTMHAVRTAYKCDIPLVTIKGWGTGTDEIANELGGKAFPSDVKGETILNHVNEVLLGRL